MRKKDLSMFYVFFKKSFTMLCIVFLVVTIFSVMNVFVVAGPPSSGDWIVTGTESYSDQTIVLNGNLIIESGGNLTFRGVTLKMKCHYDGEYRVTVNSGGSFYMLEDSIITSASLNKYSFFVWHNSTFRMSDSELHYCGWESSNWDELGLSILSDDAVIENCLISNNFCAVSARSSGVVIRNNNITANGGILVAGEDITPAIYNNNISRNGVGINMGGACSPSIYDNTITSNSQVGINIANATPVIRNNFITKNGEGGISYYSYSNPIIFDNTITSNNYTGITIRDHSTGTIQGNTIEKNPMGIITEESNPTIRANYIASSGGPGVFFTEGSNGFVEGNIVTNNTIGIHLQAHCNPIIQGNIITSNFDGIACVDKSKPEIHWNDIYSNTGYGVRNDDPSVDVNATYNYWGSISGPVQGPKDAVDPEEVSQYVLYNPWLTESIAPLVEITSPLSGEAVSAIAKVSTNAHARNGVQKVEFYINGLKHTDFDSPYEWNWDTTQYAETSHIIWVVVYDIYGLTTKVSRIVFVDNTPPTASIESPQSGITYYGMVYICVNATDNKEVSGVRFKVDNSAWVVMTFKALTFWEYFFNTTTLSDGQHNLLVLALDKAGNPATESINILTDNTPPSLTIQHPPSGITVGLTLTVMVQANDISNVSRVEFYLGQVLVSTVNLGPYQWAWDTTRYPNGVYVITVKAYDTIGNVRSRNIIITVNNVEVPWWQANFWSIMQVIIGLVGIVLAIATIFWSRERKRRQKRRK